MDAFIGAPPIGLFKKYVIGGAKKVRDTVRSRADSELSKMLIGPGLGRSALLPQ
jgi:hypothetical protein